MAMRNILGSWLIQDSESSFSSGCLCVWGLPGQKPHLHWLSLAFHGDRASILQQKLRVGIFRRLQTPVSIFWDINFSFFSCGFCTACEIDCISKKAVSGHPLANHSCYNFSCMNTDGYLEQKHIVYICALCSVEISSETSCALCRDMSSFGEPYLQIIIPWSNMFNSR